ncbi:uncharacterized protein At4g38062-like [Cicer arietinum]|uniref:Uncharacterized protein At4g38062-like n=1 Tax=Cicer arietinum TaxID=3827 RepID=A0A1S2YTS9_CICAR|nr:uncharacterized protein At4g38062-like [Cicer arietinum]
MHDVIWNHHHLLHLSSSIFFLSPSSPNTLLKKTHVTFMFHLYPRWKTSILNVTFVKQKAMNNVYEELDEAKSEIERLKAELRSKNNSFKNLKRSHDAQVNQIQEAISKVEKLEQELHQKANESIYAEQVYEDNKESNIKHLCVGNDKLREEGYGERFEKCEDQTKRLVLEKKENFKASKEQGKIDDLFHKLQEENMKVEEQLKWKKEQLIKQFDPSMEKSILLDEISLLQTKLNFHVKISHELQHQLQMCKQALAHEEIKRKSLEVEVLDLKSQFEGASSKYQKANLQLDCLNNQQDKDIEDLRHALKTQEANYKESKFLNEKLEQENHHLRKSIRELQESQIQEGRGSYSLSILRSNLRGLEHTHKECVSIIKARQTEWNFQLEQMTETIDNYRYALETKAAMIGKLKKELECSHSFNNEIVLLNEEMSVMLLVLKEEISEHKKLQHNHSTHKELLEESTKCGMEIDLKEHIKEFYGDLNKPNIELDERTCERSEMEFELKMYKSFVQSLKNDLEESIVTRKELEKSLLAQVDFSESLKLEKDSLDYKLEEKENRINYQQLHVFLLEQALKVRETKDYVEKTNEFDKESSIKGKNMAKYELMHHVTSLEKEFISTLIPFNSQLAEKQAEIIQLQEVCDKITEAEALATIEIEEKKLMIEELEDDIIDMEHKLKLQEQNWIQLKQLALEIEMEIEAKQLRIKELIDKIESKLRSSDVLLQKIKMENRSLLENDTKLSPERENLLCFVLGLSDKMSDCTNADTKLVDVLRSLVQSFEKDCLGGMNLKNENMILHSPTGLNKPENLSDLRSPFKELNNKLQKRKDLYEPRGMT